MPPRKHVNFLTPEFHELQKVFFEYENKSSKDALIRLAHLWTAQMSAVLRVNSSLPKGSIHFVHFEDLILKPRKTAERLFRFIGIPLSPAVEQRVFTVAHTAQVTLGVSREVVRSETVTAWERDLWEL